MRHGPIEHRAVGHRSMGRRVGGCCRALALLLLGLGGFFGCREAEPGWLAQVEGAHAQADGAHGGEDLVAALEALERAYRAVPRDRDAHRLWIRQDLCVRLADTARAMNRPADALGWSETGLGLSEVPSVALAELYRAKGDALEALGRKEAAVAALHQALILNQTLMERALRDERPGGQGP